MILQALTPRFLALGDDSESLPQRFWSWWSGEILQIVPPGMREAFDHQEQVMLVSVSDHDMAIELLHGSERRQLDGISLDSAATAEAQMAPEERRQAYPEADTVVVVLSPAQAVRWQVSLPFGAEDRIADVVGYEMDRLTPFVKEDVYFHHRIASRDADRRVVNIDLVVALRKTVDEILARLQEYGITPSKVTLAGGAGSSYRGLAAVNLLPRDKCAKKASRRTFLPTALSALAGLLAVVAISYPLVNQKIRVNSLGNEISRLGPAAIVAEQTQDEIAAAVRQGGFFADKWMSMPTKIRLLNELTRIVPDDTWLARVQILGTTVRIQGESEGASSLIGLIEASELLSDARFSSPVTKNPRTSNDRFVIEASLETGNGGG